MPMKHLIFLLLFGLFLLGPPDNTYADSDNAEMEMVSTQSLDFEEIILPGAIDGCWQVVNRPPDGMLMINNFLNRSKTLGEYYFKLKLVTGPGLFDNTHLKISGTDRLCNFNLRIDNYTKAKVNYSDIRIRGHDKINFQI